MTSSVIREAADQYRSSLQDFRAGRISADQHRSDNRRIKRGLSELEWEKAKFCALHTLGVSR